MKLLYVRADTGEPAAGLHLVANGDNYIVLDQGDSGKVRQVSIIGPLAEGGATVYT